MSAQQKYEQAQQLQDAMVYLQQSCPELFREQPFSEFLIDLDRACEAVGIPAPLKLKLQHSYALRALAAGSFDLPTTWLFRLMLPQSAGRSALRKASGKGFMANSWLGNGSNVGIEALKRKAEMQNDFREQMDRFGGKRSNKNFGATSDALGRISEIVGQVVIGLAFASARSSFAAGKRYDGLYHTPFSLGELLKPDPRMQVILAIIAVVTIYIFVGNSKPVSKYAAPAATSASAEVVEIPTYYLICDSLHNQRCTRSYEVTKELWETIEACTTCDPTIGKLRVYDNSKPTWPSEFNDAVDGSILKNGVYETTYVQGYSETKLMLKQISQKYPLGVAGIAQENP